MTSRRWGERGAPPPSFSLDTGGLLLVCRGTAHRLEHQVCGARWPGPAPLAPCRLCPGQQQSWPTAQRNGPFSSKVPSGSHSQASKQKFPDLQEPLLSSGSPR